MLQVLVCGPRLSFMEVLQLQPLGQRSPPVLGLASYADGDTRPTVL